MSIQAEIKSYPFAEYAASRNQYGELVFPSFSTSGTSINMAIFLNNQATNNSINYIECDYIGLTKETVDDTCVVKYGNEYLKVKYVNPIGRYNQVALVKV